MGRRRRSCSLPGPRRLRRLAALTRRRRRNGQGLLQGRLRAQDEQEGGCPNPVARGGCHYQGQGPQGSPHPYATQPPRPRRQPVSGYKNKRGQGVSRKADMIYTHCCRALASRQSRSRTAASAQGALKRFGPRSCLSSLRKFLT